MNGNQALLTTIIKLDIVHISSEAWKLKHSNETHMGTTSSFTIQKTARRTEAHYSTFSCEVNNTMTEKESPRHIPKWGHRKVSHIMRNSSNDRGQVSFVKLMKAWGIPLNSKHSAKAELAGRDTYRVT